MSLDCTDSHLMELLHALQNQAEALVSIHLDEIFGLKPCPIHLAKLEQAHSLIRQNIELCDSILALANNKSVDIFNLGKDDLRLYSQFLTPPSPAP